VILGHDQDAHEPLAGSTTSIVACGSGVYEWQRADHDQCDHHRGERAVTGGRAANR